MSLKTHLRPHHTYLATLARDLEISLVEAMDSSQGVTTQQGGGRGTTQIRGGEEEQVLYFPVRPKLIFLTL